MHLFQLQYFMASARLGSFSAAARSLFVSQPAVAKAVRDLESELGVKLFDRTNEGLVLTEFGQIARDQTKNILNGVERLQLLASSYATEPPTSTLTLAIAAQPLRGSIISSKFIPLFSKANPNVTLKVVKAHNSECINAVTAKAVDAAIVFSTEGESDTEYQEICSYPPQILIQRSQNIPIPTCLRASELKGIRIAMPTDFRYFYQQVKRLAGLIPNSIEFAQLEQSLEAHRLFLEDGGGLLTTPDPSIYDLFPDTQSFKISDSALEISVGLLYHKQQSNPGVKPLRAFFAMHKNIWKWSDLDVESI